MLGPHHRSPTHIPSTSPSLHYLHVNDSSLCPAEGRKRPINTTAQKARALFSPRRVVLLHPRTPTHTYVRAHIHSWPGEEGRMADGEERRGGGHGKHGHSAARASLICRTKAETKMKSLVKPRLLAGVGSSRRQSASWVNHALPIHLPVLFLRF